MTLLNRLLTIALGLFLVSAGVAKFTTGHVFQYIEFKSGIDLFHPFVNNLTGVAEILAGVAILVRPTRLIGAAGATALMIGAIAFHLSPWLGTSIPTGLADGAASPWDAADFTTTMSSTTFALAIVSAVRAASIVRTELRSRAERETPSLPAGRSNESVRV
ncbi:MAG: DoxX family protein [Actinomycetota bacterium]